MFALRLMPGRAAGLLAAPVIAAIFATTPSPADAQPIGPETVIATVNGDPITGGDLALAGAEFADQLAQVAPDRRDQAVLDLVINMRLAAAAAEASGMDQQPQVLSRLDLARDRTLYSEFLRSKFIAAVTEETVRARFDQELAKFVPQEEIHARHILVNNDQEELAKQIIAELDAGGDFAKIAAEHSTDPGSGQSGGDLGWFKRGMMVKPFEDAAFALEPGQYTKTPVKTDFGWHVILVEEKRMEAPPTFEAERARIEQELVRETFDKEIGGLRDAAKIEFATLPGSEPPPAEAEPPAEEAEPPAQ
ncbi:MAG TPA: peptidylprolyl isomerase [Bauldia sp.]|nr:peptidylprolyl isomerase [Bauldia sp.]